MQPLTPIQTQVLAGLLAGRPIAAVARENGIDRSTIYHWRKDHPHFTFALDQARDRLQTALYDEVQDLVAQALEVLAELLHSENVNIRLRVAQTLLRAANPMKANTNLHTNIGLETLADHVDGLQAITALTSAPPPDPEPECDTIRHFSTPAKPSPIRVAPAPGRNQPCPCRSGLKYKKCCGNPANPPTSPVKTAAAA